MKTKWEKVKWPHNDAEPYCNWECWQATIKGWRIILYPGSWPKEGWSYCARGSHSGFLKGFISLSAAQSEIERRIIYREGALR